MPWTKRLLRGNTVFVKTDEAGQPVLEDGRAQIVYKLGAGSKVYRPHPGNLQPTGNPEDDKPLPDGPAPEAADIKAAQEVTADTVIVYTDGACIGNPGPMGLGVVILDKGERTEISEYLGHGTNNIAELTAILRALQALPEASRERPVAVHSDSSYSIGLLTKGWKAKANKELVAELRALAKKFPKLSLVKVKGHAGIPENERCDELAGDAIKQNQ